MSRKKEHKIVDEIEMKQCGDCNKWKPLDQYAKNKDKWDNLSFNCKDCQVIARKNRKNGIFKDTDKTKEKLRNNHIIINNIAYKECGICHELKELIQFVKDKGNWDGHQNYCLDCSRQIYNEKYKSDGSGNLKKRKQHNIINNIEYKHCYKCNEYKTLDNFYHNKLSWDNLGNICKDCDKKEQRYKRLKNGQKVFIKEHIFFGNIELKHCSKCNNWIDINKFWKNSRTWDGLSCNCINCYDKLKYQGREKKLIYDRPKKIINDIIYKYCTGCKQWIEISGFSKNKGMKDGVNHYCKTCLKEACDNYRDRNREIIRKKDMEKYYANYEENKKKNRENAKKHKEQRLQYGKIYRFKNKDKCNFYNKQRRALINGSLVKLTNDEWEEIKLFFTNNNNNIICAYCHKELDLVTMDHIIPVIKKGSHSQDNIITACRNCNSSKNSSNMEEWYKKQKYYDEDKLKLIYKYILMAKIKEYIKIKESN